MKVFPTTLRAANDFIADHHRHNGRTARNGGKFAIALEHEGRQVGVAIVGNPISATFMNKEVYGFSAEVLRTCVLDSAPKGSVSCLYGACWRAWRAMGGTRLLTYTLTEETGASLRGAGWRCVASVKPTDPTWRKSDHLTTRTHDVRSQAKNKFRWEVVHEGKVAAFDARKIDAQERLARELDKLVKTLKGMRT